MLTIFTPETVPEEPEDPLFGVMTAFRNDPSDKIDLSIGVYRDNQEKVWVLPVVKKVTTFFIRLLAVPY